MSHKSTETENRKQTVRSTSRRGFLAAGGAGSLGAAMALPAIMSRSESPDVSESKGTYKAGHADTHSMGGLGTVGEISPDPYFDPVKHLTTWNAALLPGEIPAREGWDPNLFYRESKRPDGSRLREYQFVAVDREIEFAPGVYFPAWTYNNQVPGPTIRATQGDLVRVRFINQGSHPHTIHFHGWHPHEMDGAFPNQFVGPNEEFIYEFEADPVGLHLYHCHSVPLKRHIHKGLYGVFIVDPDPRRPEYAGPLQSAARSRNPDYAENHDVREFVMMMNAFDTDFDAENEVYAVNTVAFHYMRHPIPVKVGQLVRVYLVNITEFDPVNSFHLHAGFFDVFRTGTKLETSEHTDTVMLCQAERAVLEFRLRWPGQYMFHAHQSEFAELGWMGVFEAIDASETIADASGISKNSDAPKFSLRDVDGKPVSLADYAGRHHLVLVISRGSQCEHCVGQAQLLVRNSAAIRAKGAEILLVTPTVKKVGVSGIRQAADLDGQLAKSFRVNRPERDLGHGTFVIDKSGKLCWQNIAAEPFMDSRRLLAELDRVNVQG